MDRRGASALHPVEEADGPDLIGQIHVFQIVSEGTPTVAPDGTVSHSGRISTPVRGNVSEVSAAQVAIAAQRGQTHDIQCLAPLETIVNDRMTVVVTEPAYLAGVYQIDAIHGEPRHRVILCSRNTIQEGS